MWLVTIKFSKGIFSSLLLFIFHFSILLFSAIQDHQIQSTSDISTDEALDVNFDENKSEMGECKPFNIDSNSLMGDNPAYNRETFLKTFSTKELVKEADAIFQEITKLTLHDKLVVVGKT